MEAVSNEGNEYQGVVATLDYEIFRDIVINMLNANQTIAVATAGAAGVAVRTVDYANNGLKIGFFSWNYTGKIADIEANGAVALSLNHLTMEGTAAVQRNIARGNADVMIRYKSRLPEQYRRFTKLPGACFVAVQPRRIRVMRRENEALFLDTLDVEAERAYRVKLSDWK